MKALALVILAAAILTACGSKEFKTVKADVSRSAAGLVVEIKDDFDWHNIKFTLNDDWEFSTAEMTSGTKYTVRYAQFTDGDGAMFNSNTHVAKEIKIECDEGMLFGDW